MKRKSELGVGADERHLGDCQAQGLLPSLEQRRGEKTTGGLGLHSHRLCAPASIPLSRGRTRRMTSFTRRQFPAEQSRSLRRSPDSLIIHISFTRTHTHTQVLEPCHLISIPLPQAAKGGRAGQLRQPPAWQITCLLCPESSRPHLSFSSSHPQVSPAGLGSGSFLVPTLGPDPLRQLPAATSPPARLPLQFPVDQ